MKDQVEEERIHETLRVHHHVQDGASNDGSASFLMECQTSSLAWDSNYSFSHQSVPDFGMYDAINKGFDHGVRVSESHWEPGDEMPGVINESSDDSLVAWLNCDEQYLPGTLQKVADYFRAHPEVELLFGGMLMVDDRGKLLSCRKAMPMRRLYLEASYLYNYSCAMFFRQSAWRRLGGLNTAYRNAGDEEFIRRAVNMGIQTAVMPEYLSVFTYGDGNLSSEAETAVREHDKLKTTGSLISRWLRAPINLLRLAEKSIRGGMVECGTLEYEVFHEHLDVRTRFEAENPSCRWPDESKPYLCKHRLNSR